MLKVGITGGIGSGKSTVCRLFEKFGIPVYYADDRAKWLMNYQEEVKNKLMEHFGADVYQSDGLLNRAHLAGIVFKDASQLKVLNSIVHPAVFKDGQQWQREQESLGVAYTLKEAALLFETGSYADLDKIIVVTAPEDLRIKRVMERDNSTEEEVRARMNQQMPQAEKEKKADYIIKNIAWETLNVQVSELHEKLLYYAKRPKQ
ncbi:MULTISPECIES: dephospho-CoA kinase [unclassified Aureispira]|uniref:dephospho-CoA kinase n=1 Tax=unclassified Aureispira TaxID=2649989 RepID=UPI00069760EE|nr:MULTISPECIES: dephospho-CoA kinase [unclassified Aureispira]WMX13700.1 dephospho-CoA kinase [Aureispira sp. CCB-E]